MEPRIAALEARVATIEGDVKKILLDLAEIKARLTHMPTLWAIAGIMLGINAGIVAVSAFAVSVLKLAR
jgi:hypothetical protein